MFKLLEYQFVKYLIVGGFNVILDFTILYLLVEFVHLWYMSAATISFIIVLTVSFILNKLWTFQDTQKKRKISIQFIQFTVANLIGIGINLAILYALVEFFGFWYLLAKVFATAVAVIWNFLAFRLWVFKKQNQPA